MLKTYYGLYYKWLSQENNQMSCQGIKCWRYNLLAVNLAILLFFKRRIMSFHEWTEVYKFLKDQVLFLVYSSFSVFQKMSTICRTIAVSWLNGFISTWLAIHVGKKFCCVASTGLAN